MRFILLSAGIFVLETFIKQKREENTQDKEYLNGKTVITTYHNYGAFLNGGDKRPVLVKLVSVILTIVLSILFAFTFTKYGKKELRTGLSFLLGGAYSNTYDRVKRGYVVDYLNFPKLPGRVKHIVFNISDFCIIIGACLIVIKQK
jgi:signal peptidase II